MAITYTVPGMAADDSSTVVSRLQTRLSAYNDLQLTLKHIHWNVAGPNFIGIHEMLDPQVDTVRLYADEVAERIATMGGSPKGTPGAIIEDRDWDDYAIGRDTAIAHLGALDLVYAGVIGDNRAAIDDIGDLDPVTEDMLISHTAELEKYHWFVRAHLENMDGHLSTADATTEEEAADDARSAR